MSPSLHPRRRTAPKAVRPPLLRLRPARPPVPRRRWRHVVAMSPSLHPRRRTAPKAARPPLLRLRPARPPVPRRRWRHVVATSPSLHLLRQTKSEAAGTPLLLSFLAYLSPLKALATFAAGICLLGAREESPISSPGEPPTPFPPSASANGCASERC